MHGRKNLKLISSILEIVFTLEYVYCAVGIGYLNAVQVSVSV